MEPTYKIAQALHARRAAVGLPKYGQHLTADSPGCMIVHALEESADKTNYLIAEVQRRKHLIEKLEALAEEMRADKAPVWAFELEKLSDLLGGRAALAKYDEILGTVAENATVAPDHRDEALRVAADALEAIDHLVFTRGVTMDGKLHWQLHVPGQSEAIEKVRAALAAIRGAR